MKKSSKNPGPTSDERPSSQSTSKSLGVPFSKRHDAFQKTSRLIIQFLYEQKPIFIIICLLLMLTVSFLAVSQYYQGESEKKAQNQLYLSFAQWDALQKKALLKTEGENKKSDSPSQIDQLLQKKSSQKIILSKKDYEEISLGYQNVMNDYAGTKGAILAALYLVDLHKNQENPQAALDSLKQVKMHLKVGDLIDSIALMSLADLHVENHQCQEAIEIWSTIINVDSLSFLHADALLKQGLCFEGVQEIAKARANYEKLSMDYAQLPSGQTAKRFLHLMKEDQ